MPAPYQLHTTRPYLTNRTYRENAEALEDAESLSAFRALCRAFDLPDHS